MSELQPLVVMGGFHGRIEPVGGLVTDRLLADGRAIDLESDEPADGAPLVAGIANRPAWDDNVRYTGEIGELGSLIPGDKDSADSGMRQAAWLHDRLTALNPWLNVDIHCHDGSNPGPDYINVNARTTPAAIAVAGLLGISHVVAYAGYPYLQHHPVTVGTEQPFNASDDDEAAITRWLAVIDEIQERGPDGMADLYEELLPDLRFYQHTFSLRPMYEGKPNRRVLDVLEELERSVPAHAIRRFAPVELSQELSSHLGLDGLDLSINTWNHGNQSTKAAHLGNSALTGVVRRECFGDGFVALGPPTPTDDGWLQFDCEPRRIPR